MAELMRDDGGRWRERRDGWTAARRTRFLNRLAETGCVRDACRAAGVSNTSGYRLRRRCPAFAAEWERALRGARPTLEAAAYARAVEGWEEPVYQGGRLVGTRRRYSDALLRLLILRGDMGGADGVPLRRAPNGRMMGPGQVYDASVGRVVNEMTQEEARAEVMRRLDLLAADDPDECEGEGGGGGSLAEPAVGVDPQPARG